jgi:hypothetical protein
MAFWVMVKFRGHGKKLAACMWSHFSILFLFLGFGHGYFILITISVIFNISFCMVFVGLACFCFMGGWNAALSCLVEVSVLFFSNVGTLPMNFLLSIAFALCHSLVGYIFIFLRFKEPYFFSPYFFSDWLDIQQCVFQFPSVWNFSVVSFVAKFYFYSIVVW